MKSKTESKQNIAEVGCGAVAMESFSSRGRAISINEAREHISFLPEYVHRDSRNNEVYYKPQKHARASKTVKHDGFIIRYSLPKRGGAAVASLWVEPKASAGHGVKMRVHIDLDQLVGPLIAHSLSGNFQAITEPWHSWLKMEISQVALPDNPLTEIHDEAF